MAFDALSDVSDEALLVLYANGDRGAAHALTIRLVPRLLGYAARLLGDRAEAEDVAQEAMLKLWHMAPHWQQGEGCGNGGEPRRFTMRLRSKTVPRAPRPSW